MKSTVSLLLTIFILQPALQDSHYVSLYGIFNAINDIRAHPAQYATYIKTQIYDKIPDKCTGRHQTGMTFGEVKRLADNSCEITSIVEAMNFLQTAQALPNLAIDEGLVRQAYAHAKWLTEQTDDFIRTNGGQHKGVGDKTNFWDRMKTNNVWAYGNIAENICDSHQILFNNNQLTVLIWVIDDRVLSRGHRVNLFNPVYTKIGLGIKAYNRGGFNKDKVVLNLGTDGVYNCPDSVCGSFTQQELDEMCWTKFQNNQDSC